MKKSLKEILRENLLKEDKNEEFDPKLLTLIDYLNSNDKFEDEYGLATIWEDSVSNSNERGRMSGFETEGGERFLVGTERAAIEYTRDIANDLIIDDFINIFNNAFIIEHLKVLENNLLGNKFLDDVRDYKYGHIGTDICRSLINNYNNFIEDGYNLHGRGYFSFDVDGEENRHGDYVIYQTE